MSSVGKKKKKKNAGKSGVLQSADLAVTKVPGEPDEPNEVEGTVLEGEEANLSLAEPGSEGGSATEPGSEGESATEPGSEGESATEPGSEGESATEPPALEEAPRLVPVSAADSEPPGTLPAGDVGRAHLKGLIEALVFVSDHPMTVNEIAKAAGKADRQLVRALVDELRHDYGARGIHLDEVAGGIVFRTSAAYAPFIRDVSAKKPVRMTRAQLETLAIMAYRQPITRPEVDDIRGVDSGPVMKMLLERDLVKILGKKDEPGRPLLYGTTPLFLEFFGLKSLKELPSLREFTELTDDSRRVYAREMDEPFESAAPATSETLGEAAAQALGVSEDMFESPTDPEIEPPARDTDEVPAEEAPTDPDADPPDVEASPEADE
jgi:segregation and condensation protein B